MSYEQDLDEILIEMDRIYRRAMEAPMSNLSPEQAMEIKQHQFNAKEKKKARVDLTPTLKEGYAQIQRILDSQHPGSAEHQEATKMKKQMLAEIEERRAELKYASEILERTLGSL